MSLGPYEKIEGLGPNPTLVGGGEMSQQGGATAEKILLLDPASRNNRVDGTHSRPPLLARVVWANPSGVRPSLK